MVMRLWLILAYGACSEHRDMFRTKKIYTALRATRSFLSLRDVSKDTEVQWRLLRPLLEAGFGVEGDPEGAQAANLCAEDREILEKCLKSGYLISHHHPVRGELYSCNTPLHLYYLQDQLLCARAQHVQQGPESLAAFVHIIITRLSAQRLQQTLSVGASAAEGGGHGEGGSAAAGNDILERKLQMDLQATALSLVPHNWNVCPDVGKVRQCMANRLHLVL